MDDDKVDDDNGDIVESVLFVGHFFLFYGSTKIDVLISVHGQVTILYNSLM